MRISFRRLCDAKWRQGVPLTARLALVFWLASLSASGQTLELIRKIPHSGYSEGLDFHEGFLWHSLPKAILKIDPKDGNIVGRYVPASEYSESLTWFQGKLWNVSFSDNGIYTGNVKGDKLEWKRVGTTPEDRAWGLISDGKSLIMTGSYGSYSLYFLDPKTMRKQRELKVPIKELEDLAWDGVGIWSSSFTEFRGAIFRIDPKTGFISDLFSLPSPEECPVIDGIAWDGKGLWVTGKECPAIFYFKKPPESALKMVGKKKPASQPGEAGSSNN